MVKIYIIDEEGNENDVVSSSKSTTDVSIDTVVNSGKLIANIDINGETKLLFCPESNISYIDLVDSNSSVEVGKLIVDNKEFIIRAPLSLLTITAVSSDEGSINKLLNLIQEQEKRISQLETQLGGIYFGIK